MIGPKKKLRAQWYSGIERMDWMGNSHDPFDNRSANVWFGRPINLSGGGALFGHIQDGPEGFIDLYFPWETREFP